MKRRVINSLVHFFVWLVMIGFSYLTTVNMLILDVDPSRDRFFLFPFITINLLMIGIFYLNYYLIIPKILFKGQYVLYGIICVAIFVLILKIPSLAQPGKFKFHFAPKPPNHEMQRNKPCPNCPPFVMPKVRGIPPLFHNMPPPVEQFKNAKFEDKKGMIFPLLFNNMLLMYIISFVASITIRLSNRMREVEKERSEAQLKYLKSQVNPHFLYNTLNGIYALTLIKSDAAPKMVERLSKIMRYSLREAHEKTVFLNDELQYIADYIELQRSRLTSQTLLSFSNKIGITDLEIAPLLFIPFIENAFKYGVSTEEESIINIYFELNENEVQMVVKNTKVALQQALQEKSEMGIENTRARLDLTYPGNYELFIADRKDDFFVLLKIKLSHFQGELDDD